MIQKITGMAIVGLLLLSGLGWAQGNAGSVIERYYAAIEQHDYKTAYTLWKSKEAGSPRSLATFTAGFEQTAHTAVNVLKAGRQEGAAGSVYVTIPVQVTAELKDGRKQKFAGSYTLRRRNGPAKEQNDWYIYSARLKPTT